MSTCGRPVSRLHRSFAQTVQGLRSEYRLDIGRALADGVALCEDPQPPTPITRFGLLSQLFPSAQLAEHFSWAFSRIEQFDQDNVGLGSYRSVPGRVRPRVHLPSCPSRTRSSDSRGFDEYLPEQVSRHGA